ncbi:MAG TPA: 1,4-dihydroxy-2-naphthoate octaprenyltransferase, partial [Streptosporangiaceae bacterium]|nr:1,4-dihydroxy-2-naphthoate octaprenyltransferase [Streptosporangiaceae bacterium]
MATLSQWVAGSRPRTLPSSLVPVIVGTGVAVGEGHAVWWRAALAAFVSLALQVGVNYANDYSDGVRGTDEVRVGPLRLVGSGVAKPKQVLAAALGSFLAAAVAGLVLAAVTSWWLLLVGAVAIVAAWFY